MLVKCISGNKKTVFTGEFYTVTDETDHEYHIQGFKSPYAKWRFEVVYNLLERFKNREVALHTPTQEIYDKLMKWCDKQGIVWSNDEKATERDVWGLFKDETTICITCKKLTIYTKDFLKCIYGFSVVTLSDTDFNETTFSKENLWNCIVMETRNGKRYFFELISITGDSKCLDSDPSENDVMRVYTADNIDEALYGEPKLQLIGEYKKSKESTERDLIMENIARLETELGALIEDLKVMNAC